MRKNTRKLRFSQINKKTLKLSTIKKKEIVFALIIFSIISFVFVIPIFINIHNWGIQDWTIHSVYDGSNHIYIVMPYYAGLSLIQALV